MQGDPTTAEPISFRLNGRDIDVSDPPNGRTLLAFLRANGLTAAKEGCAEGECGACAVLLVAPYGDRSALRAINSCLTLLPTIANHEIYTVESIADWADQSAAQRAIAAAGASQCGYCTPGFVASLVAEQYRPDREGPCLPTALSGNLCRCTGYRPIVDAATSVIERPSGVMQARLTRPALDVPAIDRARFSRPASVDALLSTLANNPDAVLVAGGTDLAVDVNLRGRVPAHLVSIVAIDELQTFRETDGSITIGAALTLTEIGRRWTTAPAFFAEWLELFASPLIRNRATLGGNLATASPVGDSAPLLLALDASVQIAGSGGRRDVPLSTFFRGYRKTALARNEVLVSISIPKPLAQHVRFYKVSKRRFDDISTVAAAFALDLDGERVTRARLAYGGVAATPVRAMAAEEQLTARGWDDTAVRAAMDAVSHTLTPRSDHRGSSGYRLAMASSLVEKFAWEVRP
ncbi:MAG TPA: FAD binding domain-containing protein [Gemmatimonadaceae bacterium]